MILDDPIAATLYALVQTPNPSNPLGVVKLNSKYDFKVAGLVVPRANALLVLVVDAVWFVLLRLILVDVFAELVSNADIRRLSQFAGL